jgi:hypothetical protein
VFLLFRRAEQQFRRKIIRFAPGATATRLAAGRKR